jgi:hypothetical protein
LGTQSIQVDLKTKKTTVKTIGKDEYGMPTVNGKRVLAFRIIPKGKKS